MATPMNIEFKEISWSDCKKIWVHHLWPGRPLQTMSSMVPYGELHLHEYKVDMEIYKKYFPYFFGAYVDGKLVGVNSGHKTSETNFRSRGLYVLEEFRGLKASTGILQHTVDTARDLGCTMCWTMPREKALPAYEKVGFVKISEWFPTETSESNCYAERKLDE
tara:strand:- start:17342 stop:17830 length:489 start_codon:yes stop_codon:yes gene_type:complete